jgi:hypothetical protein
MAHPEESACGGSVGHPPGWEPSGESPTLTKPRIGHTDEMWARIFSEEDNGQATEIC